MKSKTISSVQDSILGNFDKTLKSTSKSISTSLNKISLNDMIKSSTKKLNNSYYMSGCSNTKKTREFPTLSNRFIHTGK